MTFTELYTGLLRSAAENKLSERIAALVRDPEISQSLDMLLHPKKHAPVWRVGSCSCPEGGGDCTARCIYNAIRRDEKGSLVVDEELCVGCEGCIRACRSGCLTASRDVLPVLDAIKNAQGPVYAMAAPAAAGQFGVSSVGQLRAAFKRLGFADMAEVALFADILTLKEALVFDRNIRDDSDFMLASCCCPVWIAMVRRGYSRFLDRMPDAVSPMIACGRAIKRLVPNAVTVFIGPCLAKKVEAREKDIADAVDFVLTFEELRDIFTAFGISPPEEAYEGGASEASGRMPTPSQRMPLASADGRIYGRTGGVSRAVKNTVRRLNPHRTVQLRAIQADGTKSCRALLEELTAGRVTANYLEGMGCEGGCVGGPKVLIDPQEGRRAVESYAGDAPYGTPLDNPAVPELLRRLGYETIESLLDEDGIFTRHFEEFVRKG
jgi:iron only hydrogenase large subunit-like protein